MATDLGDIFSAQRSTTPASKPAETPAPVQQAPAETPATTTATAPETQVAAQPKGETEPAQAEHTGDVEPEIIRDAKGRFVRLEALHEERTGRKEAQKRARDLEAQLAHLNGKLEALQQYAPTPAQQQQQAPHDPEAESNEYYKDPVAWTKHQMAKELEATGEELARSMHEDYDAVVAELAKAARSSPALAAQVMAQPPARRALTAYKLGKQFAQAAKFESVEAMEKHFRADERAKVTEELRKQYALAAADQAPKTVAASRGNGADTKPVWSGPKPLDRIFPGY